MMIDSRPKVVGERSEACILAALLKAGMVVLQPFGNNQRYDLVIDRGGAFVRVQCKTGRLARGSIVFPVASKAGGHAPRRGYLGEVDAFGVYCPELGRAFLVPITEISSHRNNATLRVAPLPQEHNGRSARWALDYEIGSTAERPTSITTAA